MNHINPKIGTWLEKSLWQTALEFGMSKMRCSGKEMEQEESADDIRVADAEDDDREDPRDRTPL